MTRDEAIKICQIFNSEYQKLFNQVGNTLTSGIGCDELTKEPNIVVYLQNNKNKDVLPKKYQDMEVIVKIIGAIRPC